MVLGLELWATHMLSTYEHIPHHGAVCPVPYHILRYQASTVWWHTSVISQHSLRRLQKVCKFQTSLGYIAKPSLRKTIANK